MKTYLIISQLLFTFTLPFWFFIWGMSFMSFDNGVNVSNASFVLFITLYPVVVIAGSILGWLFRVKKKKFAVMINLLPIIWIIGFLTLIALGI